MRRPFIPAILGFAVLLVVIVWVFSLISGEEPQPSTQLPPVAAADPAGFARATGVKPLSFPEDYGPHPDYQTEWWYYTGNLEAPEGRRFGYQLTFFRRALVPPAERISRDSDWAADQIYMAHFAVTDVAAGRFRAFERFSRGSAGLAGAQSIPYLVWLEDWRAEEVEPSVRRLQAAQDGLAIDLTLTGNKEPVLQGEQGYSRKGPEAGNASQYYSLTRLVVSGTVTVQGETYEVQGLSWMDHEFSTSALAPDQVGWDWFAIQMDDNTELMVFQIRKTDGSIDPFSSGTFVDSGSRTLHLDREDFELASPETWQSPQSGAIYPSHWQISVPRIDLILEIEPLLKNQELNVSYTYWEGAVRVQGTRNGQEVTGYGYVELTGYAGSMQRQF